MKQPRKRVEIDMDELRRVLDKARQQPLEEAEYLKMKVALDVLAERLTPKRTSEKARAVVAQPPLDESTNTTPDSQQSGKTKGHGRNAAADYAGARKVVVRHANLTSGDTCPGCACGKVYAQRQPRTLVRVVGQAPVEATVFEMERLRCNACGEVFTAEEPGGIGAEKYDASAMAMVAQLKYGTGVPFARLERLEGQMGIPLPAATQWELAEQGAISIQPAFEHLIWQAAQGGVLHNDDTGMRILRLAREPSDKRTGIFTTGIVSLWQNHKIALFFTGPKHAGENLADLLKQRSAEMNVPIQMCDALSRNNPKAHGVKTLLANCLTHGRRQFVDIVASFPQECMYVLESLGMVYANEELVREQGLDDEARLQFHQQYSGPLMSQLHDWLREQLEEAKTEPNSGLGKAISYLLKHWKPLTLFLREKGAPLDNNICERALKKAILNRKNAMFYKTLHGAFVGDLFMSLIHTCELNGVNSFHYLTELQNHASDVERVPADWMPWSYRDTLACRPSAAVA
jgi:transposase